MAGSLVLIDEFTISSAVASVTLGGGSSGSSGLNATIDSTFDVYLVIYDNVQPSTDAQKLNIRFTVSGSPDTSSNYDKAQWATVLNARQGAGVLTVAQATDGIQYFFGSGNIETGTFKLYGIKN